LAKLEGEERLPDAVVCDYRLPDGTGIEAIEQLRDKVSYDVPAVLVSGDTAPELLLEAGQSGYPLLHKPVRPMKLRALLSQLLARESIGHPPSSRRRESG
jgi:CheY-like chemotaxis protein